MARNERHYTMPMHWGCSNGSSNAAPRGQRGCKDSDCPSKPARKALTNRLRRADSKAVIRAVLCD